MIAILLFIWVRVRKIEVGNRIRFRPLGSGEHKFIVQFLCAFSFSPLVWFDLVLEPTVSSISYENKVHLHGFLTFAFARIPQFSLTEYNLRMMCDRCLLSSVMITIPNYTNSIYGNSTLEWLCEWLFYFHSLLFCSSFRWNAFCFIHISALWKIYAHHLEYVTYFLVISTFASPSVFIGNIRNQRTLGKVFVSSMNWFFCFSCDWHGWMPYPQNISLSWNWFKADMNRIDQTIHKCSQKHNNTHQPSCFRWPILVSLSLCV